MGILTALISCVLCAVLYVRMVRREVPEPLTGKRANIPVAIGLFAPILATALALSFGFIAMKTTGSLNDRIANPVLRSLVGSFLTAGATEEFVKFLLFLPVVKHMKPKNVYEYGLLCAGIGFGFTAIEEVSYGADGAAISLFRLPCFALHMVFGLVMGLELGCARLCRQKALGGAGKHRFLALFLPILWHTVFDAATGKNAGLESENEKTLMIAMIAAAVVVLASFVLQIVLLVRYKKKTEALCEMGLE